MLLFSPFAPLVSSRRDSFASSAAYSGATGGDPTNYPKCRTVLPGRIKFLGPRSGWFAGARTFYGFSGTADGIAQPINYRTLFEIGSNTKTFTTTLLGLDVALGKKSLNDPALDYLPGLSLQPKFQPVTLLELADFRSSLPDLPAYGNRPYDRGLRYYTLQEYFKFIQSWTPPTGRVPSPYLYSNMGVGLLGYCLVENPSLDGLYLWADRVENEILKPLAMRDTSINPDAYEAQWLALGFQSNGDRAIVWPLQAWAAAGALRSSPRDLISYLKAYLGETKISAAFTRATRIATQPRYWTSQKGGSGSAAVTFQQALAWEIHSVPTSTGEVSVVCKDGGTDGFSSELVFSRKYDLGIVVLMNKSGADPFATASDIVQGIVPMLESD